MTSHSFFFIQTTLYSSYRFNVFVTGRAFVSSGLVDHLLAVKRETGLFHTGFLLPILVFFVPCPQL